MGGGVKRAMRLLLLALVAPLLVGCGPSTSGLSGAVVTTPDEAIEMSVNTGAPLEAAPPHLLVCGLSSVLKRPADVVTYLSQRDDVLSLYDFSDPSHLGVWGRVNEGARAYQLRTPPDKSGPPIGRRTTDYCYGDGERAKGLVGQLVVHRAGGRDANEAVRSLLQTGRTTHFVIDRNGTIYQTLDPVHAAYAPGQKANATLGIFIALVSPRQPGEWAPSMAMPGATAAAVLGAAGLKTAGASAGDRLGLTLPDDLKLYEAPSRCRAQGREVTDHPPSRAQREALEVLISTLRDEFPLIEAQTPSGESAARLPRSWEYRGVLVDPHTHAERSLPACVGLSDVVD